MTDEAAFRAALAAAPDDEFMRCVYADWLDDHERYEEAAKQRRMAPGYRALVVQGRVPRSIDYWSSSESKDCVLYCFRNGDKSGNDKVNGLCNLPGDWFRAIPVSGLELPRSYEDAEFWRDYPTAQQATDAAALAFADLPAERQAELLAGSPEALNSAAV